MGEAGDGGGNVADEKREFVEAEAGEIGEIADGWRNGSGNIGVCDDEKTGNSAGGAGDAGVAFNAVPVAAGGGGGPGGEVVGVVECGFDRDEGALVVFVAFTSGGEGEEEEEEKGEYGSGGAN